MPKTRRNLKPSVKLGKIKLLGLCVFLLFATLIVLFVRSLMSNKPNAVTVAVAHENGDIEVRILDFSQNLITKVFIPADAEVELARQRGVLRAKSVWKLVESEGLAGELLSDTVMKTFHFPVDFWARDTALRSLTDRHTDLSFPLRIKAKLLAIRNSRIEEIKLSETPHLLSKKLTDGEEGYVIRGSIPLSVLSLFSDSNISEEQTAVRVLNKTGRDKYYLSDLVGVFTTLGAKVAPIIDQEAEDIDCVVKSENKEILSRVASVFNCEAVLGEPEAFNIEIILGSKFYERF